ncbi:hypothetical protein C8R46DRAFT_1106507 [Mycena filopes]|nr:hypothetical protein C8R46DRAFT_1106507 [Mycena filopes]
MASTDAEAGAGCCGIVLFSALAPWCNTKAFGSGDSNRLAGCCGSCCNKSFNEDSADAWAKPQPETTQPKASEPMSIPSAPASTDPAATNPTAPAAAVDSKS